MGYLFAIQAGARFIYDTDQAVELLVDPNDFFNYESSDHGLMLDCDSPQILNPYGHFGQPLIWPIGFPSGHIHKSHYNNYICGRRKTSIVQQGLLNGEPYVDALYSLTKTIDAKQINASFDHTAPSVQYPVYKMAPFNSRNTLFHYGAFWSLYLAHTVPLRLADIWRSYWAQRLMWLLDETVMFLGPNAQQQSDYTHSYLKESVDEQAIYLKTDQLIQLLNEWKCLRESFYACLLDLSLEMVRHNFWLDAEIESIQYWLNDLTSIGYKEPIILNNEQGLRNCSNKLSQIHNKVKSHRYKLNEIDYFPVRYSPVFMGSIERKLESLLYMDKICSSTNVKLKYDPLRMIENSSDSLDITLLVTFNHEPKAFNVEFLTHFYRGFFERIIFCGDKRIRSILTNVTDQYTFIELHEMNAGYFHYYCMTKAIELNMKTTKGILLVGDDVFVNPLVLRQFDTTKIWFPKRLECNIERQLENGLFNKWAWWTRPVGFAALDKAWTRFDEIKNTNLEPSETRIVEQFLAVLDSNKMSPGEQSFICITGNLPASVYNFSTTSGSDIFYLPQTKFKPFNFVSKIFRKVDLFLEIAVPNLLAGLDANSNMQVLNGHFVWDKNRNHMNEAEAFVHPFKVSRLASNETLAKFCQLLKFQNTNVYIEKLKQLLFIWREMIKEEIFLVFSA